MQRSTIRTPDTRTPNEPLLQRGAVVSVDDDTRFVQVQWEGRLAEPARAEVAVSGYQAAVGDLVLLAGGDRQDWYVVGVLQKDPRPAMRLADGSMLEIRGATVQIRDDEGRLLVRYEAGSAEVFAPSGDLTLAAPSGRVVMRAGQDIEMSAARDIVHQAARAVELGAGPSRNPQLTIATERTSLETKHLEVSTFSTHHSTDRAEVAAREVSLTASLLTEHVDRVEVVAKRIVERTIDSVRVVSELLETRAGRVRSVVADMYSLYTKRTSIVSEEETTIDGKRIHLG